MMRYYWPTTATSIDELGKHRVLSPFQEESLRFIQDLSKRLISLRQYPELVALGFWCRKANIEKLRLRFEKENEERIQVARGTVLHFAPSNVDTIFVYSWILSLLSGNRNIIRVSSKERIQQNIVMQLIIELLHQHPEIGIRTQIVTYEHNDEITAILSQNCDTRVIWGGDRTISNIRLIPLAPMANELVFPDRFSLVAFNIEAIQEALKQGENVVEQFYNDAFWFDQMACSSPRLIVWVGEDLPVVRQRFWNELTKIIQQKQEQFVPAQRISRLTNSLQLATLTEVEKVNLHEAYTSVSIDKMNKEIREWHAGNGLFLQLHLDDLKQLSEHLEDKDQTLSYYGFTQSELLNFVMHIDNRGIDRIVPVGRALDFEEVWDGQSFLRSFTREVTVR